MSSSSQEFWNEFDWEKELRKDDERIHTYLKELPSFIDLPGEDDLIFKRIQRHEELVPHGGVWPFERWNNPPPDEPENNRSRNDILRGKPGADMLIACCRLARSFCLLHAMDPALGTREEIMRIQCFLGKMTVHLVDMLGLHRGELPALRIALCKRTAAAINDIFGQMNLVCQYAENEESAVFLESLKAQLRLLREQILEFMNKLRHPDASGKFPPGDDNDDDWEDDDQDSDIPF